MSFAISKAGEQRAYPLHLEMRPLRVAPDADELILERVTRPGRLRSDGTLTREELELCEASRIPVAYDPIQIGWVPEHVIDDITGDGDGSLAPRGVSVAHHAAIQWKRRASSLELRPWTQDDVERYVELLDNPQMWRYLPEDYPAPLTASVAADLIRVSNEMTHHDVRAVEQNGEVVGQVRLLFGAQNSSEAEISYWVGEAYWGQGIAGAIIPLYTTMAFEQRPELRSIFARVHRDNAPSARALRRAGYRLEGRAGDTQVFRIFR